VIDFTDEEATAHNASDTDTTTAQSYPTSATTTPDAVGTGLVPVQDVPLSSGTDTGEVKDEEDLNIVPMAAIYCSIESD
jgi:hypothetical protein